MGNRRNGTLDMLKLIAAYMVVLIHVSFQGRAKTIIHAVANFAVPVFFLSAGYFCYGADTSVIERKIIKIAKIFVFASALYNLMNIALAFLADGMAGAMAYLTMYVDINRWVNLLLFNVPFSATRLWFLLALMYVYGVQWHLVRWKISHRTIMLISVCFLVLNVVLGECLSILGVYLPEYYL